MFVLVSVYFQCRGKENLQRSVSHVLTPNWKLTLADNRLQKWSELSPGRRESRTFDDCFDAGCNYTTHRTATAHRPHPTLAFPVLKWMPVAFSVKWKDVLCPSDLVHTLNVLFSVPPHYHVWDQHESLQHPSTRPTLRLLRSRWFLSTFYCLSNQSLSESRDRICVVQVGLSTSNVWNACDRLSWPSRRSSFRLFLSSWRQVTRRKRHRGRPVSVLHPWNVCFAHTCQKQVSAIQVAPPSLLPPPLPSFPLHFLLLSYFTPLLSVWTREAWDDGE